MADQAPAPYQEFGASFSVRNLQQMKKFYVLFPNVNALRSHLTWTHYRTLLRVENDDARNWYAEECIRSGWSSRQLERQISTLFLWDYSPFYQNFPQTAAGRGVPPYEREPGFLLCTGRHP